jgi:hypothetical protein
MVEASCHCGKIRLQIDAPREVTACNCSICRRYGVLWAYCPVASVHGRDDAETDTYVCHSRSQAFHRCPACGCVTHWRAFDTKRERMGVNARLLPPEILAAARVRHLDGAVSDTYID